MHGQNLGMSQFPLASSLLLAVATVTGLTAQPSAALAPIKVEAPRQLKVTKLGGLCFRLSWKPPYNSRGYQYQIRIHGANTPDNYDFRSSTFKTRLKICGLPENYYTANVRELGGYWRWRSFKLGSPDYV